MQRFLFARFPRPDMKSVVTMQSALPLGTAGLCLGLCVSDCKRGVGWLDIERLLLRVSDSVLRCALRHGEP